MDIDWLEAEIDRLSRMPKAEIGVPMFLIPENLASDLAPGDGPGRGAVGGTEVSRAFDAAVQLLEARRGPLSASDIAAIVEVVAEHHMLDHPFSSLGGEAQT